MRKRIQGIWKGISRCLEGDGLFYAGILAVVALIVICALVIPVEMDKPEMKRKGVREPYGDLRDRER